MAQMNAKKRQAIVDDYLNQTRRNMFVAHEFVDWLAGQPDHEAYPWFFSDTDEDAARKHRVSLARKFVSGLRITVQQAVSPSTGKVVKIEERQFPAFVSPVSMRSSGGGYVSFDPKNVDHMGELRREGAQAMATWLERYEGAFADIDLSALKKISALHVGTGVAKSA